MLMALERGVKGNVWFSLIDKIYAPRTLELAWEKVQSNAGACGVDCITVEHIADRRVLDLIESFLKQGIMNSMGKIEPEEHDEGTPQGGVI